MGYAFFPSLCRGPYFKSYVANLFNSHITDINCGMRGLTKDAFLKLDLFCSGMEFASEIFIKALVANLQIVEIPVFYRKDKRNRPSHLRTFRDGWRHLRFILLFAPTGIFLIPGIFSFVLGFILMFSIIFSPPNNYFGIFSMLICQSLIFLGVQLIFYSASSYWFSQSLQYIKKETIFYRIFAHFTIEKGVILGGISFLVGSVISCIIAFQIYHHIMLSPEFIFRSDLTKWGFLGITSFILGIQIIVLSFCASSFNIKLRWSNKICKEEKIE